MGIETPNRKSKESRPNVLPQATVFEIKKGGHQFDDELNFLAEDIKEL